MKKSKSKCLTVGKKLRTPPTLSPPPGRLTAFSFNPGTSAEGIPQQTTANHWSNVPAPIWMGPLAYYNEDMQGHFQTGLSYVLQQQTLEFIIILMLIRREVLLVVQGTVIDLRSKSRHPWRTPCLRLTKRACRQCGMICVCIDQ